MAKIELTQCGVLTRLDSGSQSVILEVYQEDLSGTMCDIDLCFVPLNATTVPFLEDVCKAYRAKGTAA